VVQLKTLHVTFLEHVVNQLQDHVIQRSAEVMLVINVVTVIGVSFILKMEQYLMLLEIVFRKIWSVHGIVRNVLGKSRIQSIVVMDSTVKVIVRKQMNQEFVFHSWQHNVWDLVNTVTTNRMGEVVVHLTLVALSLNSMPANQGFVHRVTRYKWF